MQVAKRQHEISQAIKLPFAPEESERFRSFLKATGRKAGPWVRTLVLKAMDEAERIGDGSGQAKELAAALEEAKA